MAQEASAVNAAHALLNYLSGGSDNYQAKTATRMVRGLKEILTPDTDWEFTTFKSDSDEMVLLGPIHFVSMCAHHVLPFLGTAHVAYIPKGHIVGLSKVARLVKQHAASLSVQEELTTDIAKDLFTRLEEPLGVAVLMKAEHMCMTVRGVQSAGTMTTTSKMLGVFSDHKKTAKAEFLSLLSS